MISYGSQPRGTEMSNLRRSHQLGEGHHCDAAMPISSHPPRLVLGSQQDCTPMSPCDRSHQLGKGQGEYTGMSVVVHPSRPVYGSRNHNAAMPMEKRSHLFTRGHSLIAERPIFSRLTREGSDDLRSNVTILSPFPTSFGPPQLRSNANLKTPN